MLGSFESAHIFVNELDLDTGLGGTASSFVEQEPGSVDCGYIESSNGERHRVSSWATAKI